MLTLFWLAARKEPHELVSDDDDDDDEANNNNSSGGGRAIMEHFRNMCCATLGGTGRDNLHSSRVRSTRHGCGPIEIGPIDDCSDHPTKLLVIAF